MIGSYAGRMQPPGSPNMTSTFSISRLLMRACAPVSFMVLPGRSTGAENWNDPPAGRSWHGARCEGGVLGQDYEKGAGGHGVTSVAAFPGSYNPPTIAHLAMAEATCRQCKIDRVDLILSREALGKEHVVHPTVEERARVLEAVAATRPWLGVVLTERRLLVDIAQGYDVLVLGADKWEQVLDPTFYGDSLDAMKDAVARLPHLAMAARKGHALPTGGVVTMLDVEHHEVSSTAARSGQRELMLPEALASGLW